MNTLPKHPHTVFSFLLYLRDLIKEYQHSSSQHFESHNYAHDALGRERSHARGCCDGNITIFPQTDGPG